MTTIEWHELLRTWAAAILLLISTSWTIYWSLKIARGAAAKSEQDKLTAELKTIKDALVSDERSDSASFAKMETRLQKVEDDIRHLPTKEQFHGIELAMGDMKGDLRELAVSIRPLAASVERIDNFLMERANRS
ncbi:DUF2730 family protein [Aureimonas sp. SK2]|uniref:DUF2730 family protein n=1 Tax=Aureimonas sp. SK2 TaxID=3015992 RepID=UPI002444F1F3|nr:DUF2730 family protein [Aureimonas sp. SK2]